MKRMNEGKIKKIYCLPPCPSYDVEGMEGWLSDMALHGWRLTEDGIFCGVAVFEKAKPERVKYRLTAAKNGTSMWGENDGNPKQDEIELSAMYGWEYTAKRGDFHIYRTSDPNARELNTDPCVQALALKEIKKSRNVYAFEWIFWLLLWIIATKGRLLLSMIYAKSWFMLIVFAVVSCFTVNAIVRTVRLGTLEKKLKTRGYLDTAKSSTRKTVLYHMGKAVRCVLVIFLIITLLSNLNSRVLGETEIPLDELDEIPPFTTLSDFAEGVYKQDTFGDWTNYAIHWSDILAPECWCWRELAKVQTEQGTLDGSLYVDYFETVSPTVARIIAKEYYRKAKWDRNCDIFEAEMPEGDFAAAYYDEVHMPNMILQRGNVVIRVSLHQYGEALLSFEEWTEIVSGALEK